MHFPERCAVISRKCADGNVAVAGEGEFLDKIIANE